MKVLKPYWTCLRTCQNGHATPLALDCEQSLFFFRFSESNARARERRSRETRETRAAASPVSRHQSRAWPFACLAFCSTDY